MNDPIRLRKLSQLLEDIQQSMLGEDWQAQKQLSMLAEKVKEEIRRTG